MANITFDKHEKVLSMIFVRVVTGIKNHWHIRSSEWLMIYPSVGIGTILLYQPDMFTMSSTFNAVAEWMTQPQWSLFILICALIRLIALTVNGTFASFRYSPHLRLIAALSGVFFWSQYSLGVTTSAVFDNGAWSAPVMYSTMCLAELLNIYRTWVDVMRSRAK